MQISTGFITLLSHETYRFIRLIRQTVFPPIITTCLFILIFGFSLGDRIREIHGFPYIIYIVPGLTAMGVMMNAHTNTSFALYMSRYDQSIQNWISAPLRPVEIVIALIWGGIARGMMIGLITLGVSLAILQFKPVNIGITLLFLLLQSIFFGCFGLIGGLRAKTWDNLATTQNFVLTPLIYLGGVFYSIELLPGIWKKISMFNPLFYMVDGVRYGILGIHDSPLWLSLTVTVCFTGIFFAVCVWLFHIGYRLVK
ncbi:MAG: ABC transporter permease [Deltaproteobacteria bacterium]|nr:ABC transporter permease [Deltaproteobacteria bacterium]